MAFNPGSFTATGNVGIKPTIVGAGVGSVALLPSGTNLTFGAANVAEGNYAVAAFNFQKSSVDSTLVELRDTATINVSFDGTSAADVTGPMLYRVVYSNSFNPTTGENSGAVSYGGWMPVATVTPTNGGSGGSDNVPSAGQITLTDAAPTNQTVGTGVVGIELAVGIAKDTLVETGEHVLFKVTQSDATKFTNSFYVEQKIDIVDTILTPTVAVNGNTTTGTSGVADSYSIPLSSTANPTGNFAKLSSTGWDAGDKIKVDMVTGSQLSMVNFGNLAPVTITTEAQLLNGIRALDKELCNVGGLYIMEVGTGPSKDTYIIFDSNGSGSLDTQTASAGVGGSFDVFVKLTGVPGASLQSTNFDLY